VRSLGGQVTGRLFAVSGAAPSVLCKGPLSSSPPSLPRPRHAYAEPPDSGKLTPRKWLDGAPITRLLLMLNVAVYGVEVADAAGRGPFSLDSFRLLTRPLLELGASYPPATLGEGRWETLVTACFLHGGFAHIAFNMLALWQAGPLVERAVGSARMAPMYLLAGAAGNLLSVAVGWHTRAAVPSIGASGAISGVIASALIVGWRVQGWRGPLTQAMARWLGFVVVFGVLSNLGGGAIDNAAHVGGAATGAIIASMWRRGTRYSATAEGLILGVCGGVLALCIALVAWHDRTDPFAAMTLAERTEYTRQALRLGRCRDAQDGLGGVERLRAWAAPVTSLRTQVEATCGHAP
jgi:rhomboid protease GluP